MGRVGDKVYLEILPWSHEEQKGPPKPSPGPQTHQPTPAGLQGFLQPFPGGGWGRLDPSQPQPWAMVGAESIAVIEPLQGLVLQD